METLCDDVAQVLLELLPIHARAALRRTSKSWQASIDDGPSAIPTTAALNAAWLAFNIGGGVSSREDSSCQAPAVSEEELLPKRIAKVMTELHEIVKVGCVFGTPTSEYRLLPDPLGVYLDYLRTRPSACAYSDVKISNDRRSRATTLLLSACRARRMGTELAERSALFDDSSGDASQQQSLSCNGLLATHARDESHFNLAFTKYVVNDTITLPASEYGPPMNGLEILNRHFGGVLSPENRNGCVVALGAVAYTAFCEHGVSFLWKESRPGQRRHWWCFDLTLGW